MDREDFLDFGSLQIDLTQRKVLLNGRVLDLSVKEFDILAMFASNPGIVVTHEIIFNRVWGYNLPDYKNSVNTQIVSLRKKIEKDPEHPKIIQTVWGQGYKFTDSPKF